MHGQMVWVQVTTMLGAAEEAGSAASVDPQELEAARAAAAAAGEHVKSVKAQAKESGDQTAVNPAVNALKSAKKELECAPPPPPLD